MRPVRRWSASSKFVFKVLEVCCSAVLSFVSSLGSILSLSFD